MSESKEENLDHKPAEVKVASCDVVDTPRLHMTNKGIVSGTVEGDVASHGNHTAGTTDKVHLIHSAAKITSDFDPLALVHETALGETLHAMGDVLSVKNGKRKTVNSDLGILAIHGLTTVIVGTSGKTLEGSTTGMAEETNSDDVLTVLHVSTNFGADANNTLNRSASMNHESEG